jgi:hypothetical protein
MNLKPFTYLLYLTGTSTSACVNGGSRKTQIPFVLVNLKEAQKIDTRDRIEKIDDLRTCNQ